MNTRWHKLHGLGNDFLVGPLHAAAPSADAVSALCDRHRGLGADGILLWERQGLDVRMVIYNQDGSRPQMCGNGVRCLVAWLHQYGHLGQADQITILSDAGPRPCKIIKTPQEPDAAYQIAVQMGQPQLFEVEQVPELSQIALVSPVLGVDMGNPHMVLFVSSMPALERIDEIGYALNHPDVAQRHPQFKQGVNVEFALKRDASSYEVIVYERGVGRTQACGTGACAVAAAAWQAGLVEAQQHDVVVWLPGGPLKLEWPQRQQLWMTGPAQYVYEAYATLAL